jgi:hypothetical protein
MKTISKAGAVNLLNQTNGKFARVIFTKKDGEIRCATIRKGVKKGVKGVQSAEIRRKIALDYLTAFDVNKGGFIRIDLNTIRFVKFAGKEYIVI